MNETYSSPENLKDLNDFPGYTVSNWGRVINKNTGFDVKASPNTHGIYIVGLMKNKRQHKRSLTLLVARAFVPQTNPEFTTPINLDGDRSNNHYENLAWRPLWFARKYGQQFTDNHATFNNPIEDIETGITYKNSMHAATLHGLLDAEIYTSMLCNTYVWPTGQIFREALDH